MRTNLKISRNLRHLRTSMCCLGQLAVKLSDVVLTLVPPKSFMVLPVCLQLVQVLWSKWTEEKGPILAHLLAHHLDLPHGRLLSKRTALLSKASRCLLFHRPHPFLDRARFRPVSTHRALKIYLPRATLLLWLKRHALTRPS